MKAKNSLIASFIMSSLPGFFALTLICFIAVFNPNMRSSFGVDSTAISVKETGMISTVAGTGIQGFSGDNGIAANARLNKPCGLFVNSKGDIYIADRDNHCIRRIDSLTNIITTVAGTGERGYSGDGDEAYRANLSRPTCVFVDSGENIYIADRDSSCVRYVDGRTKRINTLAGTGEPGFSGDRGDSKNAKLYWPTSVFMNSAGDMLIADTNNHRIRCVNGKTGIIADMAGMGFQGFSGDGRLATLAMLNYPVSVFVTPNGDIFIADSDNHRIRRIDGKTFAITTMAGKGPVGNQQGGFSGDGGNATEARLNEPSGVFVDSKGDIFIADRGNNRVRRIDGSTGIITTVAGTGEIGFSGDWGKATNALLNQPCNVFVDFKGDLFISDLGNNRIRRIAGIAAPTILDAGIFSNTSTNTSTTAAVNGGYESSLPMKISFSIQDGERDVDPAVINKNGISIEFDKAVDTYRLIIKISSNRQTLDWIPSWSNENTELNLKPASGQELGFNENVTLSLYRIYDAFGNETSETDIAFDTVTDIVLSTPVSQVSIIDTVAGNGSPCKDESELGDGGKATEARLNYPIGVFADPKGNILIADRDNHRIRKLDKDGIITTIAGSGPIGRNYGGFSDDGEIATESKLTEPRGIFADSKGDIFFADWDNHCIRKIDITNNRVYTVAGTGELGFSGDGEKATKAKLNGPWGIFIDINGNMLIADRGNHRIRRIDGVTGIINTIAGTGEAGSSGDGGKATEARFNYPINVFVDSEENIYITDRDNHRIRRIDKSGIINTIAGTGEAGYSGDGGKATEAKLNYPIDVSMDARKNIFISDWDNHCIRKVDSRTGNITTVVGNGKAGFSGDGNDAREATLNWPRGIFIDLKGDIYIADELNQRIRRVSGVAAPTKLQVGSFAPE